MEFKETIEQAVVNKMKGRLFGLLREREKEGEWEKFLDTIIIEFMGMKETHMSINYNIVMLKLATLKYLRYPFFRSTILDCMNLLGKIGEQNELL